MVTVRSAKSKGSAFEYDTQHNLKPLFPDILLTKELGFVRQFDLVSEKSSVAIECKFHKKLSWNACKKFFVKLEDKAKEYKRHFLIYKTNFQPVLVMYRDYKTIRVTEFKDIFKREFKKR